MIGPQEAAAGLSTAQGESAGWWEAVVAFCLRPGMLESLLALAVFGVVAFVWWRLAALQRDAMRREALEDYLLGVEQALQGDLKGAEKRLSAVLEQDPENHYARLLLGKVLADLGHAERAHQQHLYLKKAFAVDSGDNELMLAHSLLGAGMAAEAADVAERALQRMPDRVDGWRFVYRARLQGGEHEAAAVAGRRLLALLRDGPERRRLRQDLARTVASVATLRWHDGDRRAARQLLREVEALAEQSPQLPLLRARLQAGERGVAEVARSLSTTTARDGALVAVAAGDRLPVDANELPVANFAGLVETARWTCRACDAPLPRELAECPRCGAADPAEPREAQLVGAIESPTEVMDRIDVNDAHVQRLVRRFVGGEQAVADDLLELGEPAVEELLRVAWKNDGQVRADAIALLRRFGPESARALFAASDRLQDDRLLPVGEGPDAIVGRIVQGFDRSALPHVEALFASTRPSHRRILIDYFLGLGDLQAFQKVLEHFPPMEILHRCNHADPAVLRRFLQAIPRGHFLAESLLLEPTFYRDEELLAAVPEAEDPEVLVSVMLGRGPTRTMITALLAGVADDRLAATSQRVLEELGEAAIEHVLQAYADPDCGEPVQTRLARVLVRGGAAAAAHIADSFGPEASRLDDRLRALLVILGDDAVDAMVAAYERSGWVEKVLEKVGPGLMRRHNNRRVQLATALGELGTRRAKKALATLHKREKDDNLRLHLSRVLHAVEDES